MTRGAQAIKPLKKRLGNLLFFSRMVRGAAAIHCLTVAEAADARAWGRPVFVVGNGVDLPPAASVATPAAKPGLRLLFVGRLDPHHKGLDLLIEACALASHRLRVARASIAVHGPSIAGSAQALQRLAHERGLDDLLRVKGPVYGEDKARAYAAVDLFLHTSRFEGHPMAVLEALSYGLPCLLTPGTNMADEVVAAGAGWRAEPTPQGIAGALVAAVEARQHLAAMGQRARQLVAERYTWGKVARALCEHYETIITSSPTGTAHKS
ncbi:MAG: glycosyltransferase, partial [Chloroflexi bacterium]|nr:glycosyltransferase [Chloroflexota bacterium]